MREFIIPRKFDHEEKVFANLSLKQIGYLTLGLCGAMYVYKTLGLGLAIKTAIANKSTAGIGGMALKGVGAISSISVGGLYATTPADALTIDGIKYLAKPKKYEIGGDITSEKTPKGKRFKLGFGFGS